MSIKYIHTNIVSTDWRKLAEFYIKVFNCKIVPPERNLSGDWLNKGIGLKNASLNGVHLRLPGFGENGPTIEIFQYNKNEEKPMPPRANREGFGHIAFHVDDVEVVLNQIVSGGGRQLGEIATTKFPKGILTFVYTADPEGNIVEIQNWS